MDTNQVLVEITWTFETVTGQISVSRFVTIATNLLQRLKKIELPQKFPRLPKNSWSICRNSTKWMTFSILGIQLNELNSAYRGHNPYPFDKDKTQNSKNTSTNLRAPSAQLYNSINIAFLSDTSPHTSFDFNPLFHITFLIWMLRIHTNQSLNLLEGDTNMNFLQKWEHQLQNLNQNVRNMYNMSQSL